MNKNFSYAVLRVLTIAEDIARSFGHPIIGSEHALLALIKCGDNELSDELNKRNVKYKVFVDRIKDLYKYENNDFEDINYSLDLKEIIDEASIISIKNKENNISLSTFILSLLNLKNTAVELLISEDINVTIITNKILDIKKKKSDLMTITDLHLLGTNNKDPLIGRDKEIKKLICALARRNKPNAILLGDPGVGKTAIVEELAKRLIHDQVPQLKDKTIYELDIASTVSGTKYRGEFEEKLKKIIKKVKDEGNIILFIDEIHNIVKAGGAEGAIDASNILKPYLARADIQVIGATTNEEFNNSFEKDKALKRRFQIINVSENTKEDTKTILKGIKRIYEDFYKIDIEDNILDMICELSDKYLINQKFPDKAIELLDNSCVCANKELTKNDVFTTLDEIFNIDFEMNKINIFTSRFDKEIYSQDNVKEQIANNYRNNMKNYIFIGGQGVGKNKVAKLIGETLFNNDYIMVNGRDFRGKLNFSGFNSDSEIFNQMSKKIKEKNKVLIIVENIDLASKETISFFYKIMNEGYYFDTNSNKILTINVSCIFICSPNINNEFKIGNNKEQISWKEKIKNQLGYEFELCIDDYIIFNYLSEEAYEKIIMEYLEANEINMYSKEDINREVYSKKWKIRGGDAALEFAKDIVRDYKKEKIN